MRNTKVCAAFILALTVALLIVPFTAYADFEMTYADKAGDVVGNDGRLVNSPDIDIKEASCIDSGLDVTFDLIIYGAAIEDNSSVSYSFTIHMGSTYYIAKYTNGTCLLLTFTSSSSYTSRDVVNGGGSVYTYVTTSGGTGALQVKVPMTMIPGISTQSFTFEAGAMSGANSDSVGSTAAAAAPSSATIAGLSMMMLTMVIVGIVVLIVIIAVILYIVKSKKKQVARGPQGPVPGQAQGGPQTPASQIYGPPGSPYGQSQSPYNPAPYNPAPAAQQQNPYAYTDPYARPQDLYSSYYPQEPYGQSPYAQQDKMAPRYEQQPQRFPPQQQQQPQYAPPQQQSPYGPGPAAPQQQPQTQFARCHVCGGVVPIPSAQRPITIMCPACGAEGVID